jgi:hypothetical protein
LPARGKAFDKQDFESLGCAVDSGCHACRTSAGDDDVVLLVSWDSLEAEGFSNAADSGIFERCTFDRNHDVAFRLSHARLPLVLDAIGGEESSDSSAIVVIL